MGVGRILSHQTTNDFFSGTLNETLCLRSMKLCTHMASAALLRGVRNEASSNVFRPNRGLKKQNYGEKSSLCHDVNRILASFPFIFYLFAVLCACLNSHLSTGNTAEKQQILTISERNRSIKFRMEKKKISLILPTRRSRRTKAVMTATPVRIRSQREVFTVNLKPTQIAAVITPLPHPRKRAGQTASPICDVSFIYLFY